MNKNIAKYPLKLDYVAKSAIWGGNILSDQWGKQSDGDNIAETWELTVRQEEMSKITNGQAAVTTLGEYISLLGESAVSKDCKAGLPFPLLVKLIDAHDKLSVQVHPDDEYARRVEGDSGKTEMWYIVDAEEDAEIIYGLKDGVSSKDFSEAVASRRLDRVMKRVKVRKGESYFIPAGMLHAIGKGILIAEIQQNSDLTYRVYDYDRVGSDGKKRELHTKKATDVVRPYSGEEILKIQYSRGYDPSLLANSKYFKAYLMSIEEPSRITATDESFVSLLCVDGKGYIEFNKEKYEISRGDSYFLPAGMGDCIVSGKLSLICSEL